MTYKYRQKPGQSDPGRWSLPDPDTLTNLAAASIDVDTAELHDYYAQMRRMYPSIFRGWSIEQFKNWIDSKVAALLAEDEQHRAAAEAIQPVQSLCNRIYFGLVLEHKGLSDECVNELLRMANTLASQLSDAAGQPKYSDSDASQTIDDEFRAIIKRYPARNGLSPLAELHLDAIRTEIGANKVRDRL